MARCAARRRPIRGRRPRDDQAAQEGEQQNRLDHPARVGLSRPHGASFRPAPFNPLTAG